MSMQTLSALLLLVPCLLAQNCANTSVGLVPLDEMTAGQLYQGYPGGLYPGGGNVLPAAHLAAGITQMSQVVPRNAAGAPDPFGRIVVLSIGMSNATMEYSSWMPIAAADPLKNPRVQLVDGAIGGMTAQLIANPAHSYWTQVDGRLLNAGSSAQQVQVIWLKEANAGPTGGFPAATLQLRDALHSIVQILRARFPNARLCYLSSRIYAGYATTTLNPEPYAYQSAFAVRWLIEAQINGDPLLAFNNGVGGAPWLAWGPYNWGNGTTPRQDGLVWDCADFNSDGTHPSLLGRAKVANRLQSFFATSPTTAAWFHGAGVPLPVVSNYGAGCAGTNGVPHAGTNMLPRLGATQFSITLSSARPAAAATLFVSLAQAQIALSGGCTAWIDPFPPNLLLPWPGINSSLTTTAQGNGFLPFPLPANPQLGGLQLFAQWVVMDPNAANALYCTSEGLRLVLGATL